MGKIITFDLIQKELEQLDEQIILVGGCFDIIHPGHIEFLISSKKLGGVLVVMLESDKTVKKLKGPERPIHTQKDRAFVLSHIDAVDYVIQLPYLSTDIEYEQVIRAIQPSIIAVTHPDPAYEIKEKHAKKLNASIKAVIELKKPYSTTSIKDKLNT